MHRSPVAAAGPQAHTQRQQPSDPRLHQPTTRPGAPGRRYPESQPEHRVQRTPRGTGCIRPGPDECHDTRGPSLATGAPAPPPPAARLPPCRAPRSGFQPPTPRPSAPLPECGRGGDVYGDCGAHSHWPPGPVPASLPLLAVASSWAPPAGVRPRGRAALGRGSSLDADPRLRAGAAALTRRATQRGRLGVLVPLATICAPHGASKRPP